MSRLTMQEVIEHCEKTAKRIEENVKYCREWLEMEQSPLKSKNYLEHKQTAEWLKELQRYKDLADESRLIELPCKVGDTVYKLWYKTCHKGNDYPDSYFCCGCEDDCTLERAIFEFCVPSVDWILAHMKAFGDWLWFLTKAEAEAKLAELKGGAE